MSDEEALHKASVEIERLLSQYPKLEEEIMNAIRTALIENNPKAMTDAQKLQLEKDLASLKNYGKTGGRRRKSRKSRKQRRTRRRR